MINLWKGLFATVTVPYVCLAFDSLQSTFAQIFSFNFHFNPLREVAFIPFSKRQVVERNVQGLMVMIFFLKNMNIVLLIPSSLGMLQAKYLLICHVNN